MLFSCSQHHFLWEKRNEALNHLVILFVESIWTCSHHSRCGRIQKMESSSVLYSGRKEIKKNYLCKKMNWFKLFVSMWFWETVRKIFVGVLWPWFTFCAHTWPKGWNECGCFCVLRLWSVCDTRGLCSLQLCNVLARSYWLFHN